jgi:competence protein ComEC
LPWWGLALLLAAWSAGITMAMLLSPLVPWVALAVVLAIAAAVMNRRSALLAGLACIAVLLGAGRGLIAPSVSVPPEVTGQLVTVSGTVDDDPFGRTGSLRLTIRADHVLTGAGQLPSRLRILATVYGIRPVDYGDQVLLIGDLQAPPRFDQFDYPRYLAEQGIAAVMPSARLVRVTPNEGDRLHRLLFWLRHAVIDTVDRALPEPQAALVLGVVFGYRAALPPGLEQQMIASGLIHVVVVSGLNVALVAKLVQQVLGQWRPRAASVVAVAAMTAYALLAGASPAALRAAVMGGLVVLASMLKRDSHVVVSMALAAGLMLGLKPSLIHDVGFQLSFAATLGIVTAADSVAKRLGWMPGVLREPLAATLAAQALTWPLLLAQVHQVSLIGPLANMLVVPLLPFLMVAGGAGALAAGLWMPAGWLPLQAAGAVARWLQAVIQTTGSAPFAALKTPYFPASWLAAAALVNGGALVGIKLRQFFWHRKVWAALGGTALLVTALLLIRPDGRVHVYALDVGTGSAVLVRTAGGKVMLIDGGPDPDRFAQAIGRALPPTARTIDLWLITGGRRTHIGASPAVLKRFQIGRVVVADPDPWSPTLRSLVQQAQDAGVTVLSDSGPMDLDGVRVGVADDGRSWLIDAQGGVMAIIPPQTRWRSLPPAVQGAIFTSGGPTEWQGPGRGFSAIQVTALSRDGLPVRTVLRALGGAPVYRTDRLGTIELVAGASAFRRAE